MRGRTGRPAESRTIKDGRGRRVPAVTLGALAGAGDAGDAGDARRRDLARRVRTETSEDAWRVVGRNVLWGMLLLLALRQLEDALLPRHAFEGLPRGLAVAGLLAGVAGIAWWAASRRLTRRRARLAVKAGFCGSCGYDLERLEREADGCVVCPECAAAWMPKDPEEPRMEEGDR
jgi:hypothetical protein